MFYDKDEFKSYDDIKNKFKSFRLDEEYELELKCDGHESMTAFRFFLNDDEEENIFYFFYRLEVNLSGDLRYFDFVAPSFDLSNLEILKRFHKNNCVKIKYETKFYKFNEFVFDDDEEYYDDEELDEPPPLELSYHYDECVICYEEKPNILNYPCLHLSQCEACDEKGKFKKCVICKEEIEYRIKI